MNFVNKNKNNNYDVENEIITNNEDLINVENNSSDNKSILITSNNNVDYDDFEKSMNDNEIDEYVDKDKIFDSEELNTLVEEYKQQELVESQKYIIRCVNINKIIKTNMYESKILSNINLSIEAGEIVVILGASGSGKTTLLNIIAGMEQPTSGDVFMDGLKTNKLNDRQLTKLRKEKIAYIYQKYGLIPISTVYDNIRLGQNLVHKKNRKIDFDFVINKTGLQNYLNKFPHELSGGQKQRVSIARAILKQPLIMLCDEPTGALDAENSDRVIELFKTINKEFNTTIVMVTHNNELTDIANKIVYIKNGMIEKIVVQK